MFKPVFQLLIAVALFFGLWHLLAKVNWMHIFKVELRIKKSQRRIADLYLEFLRKEHKEIEVDSGYAPIDTLFTRLCTSNGIDRNSVQLHIFNSEEINAFALPGGHLVLYTALLQDCRNEAELSSVIAHELAHIQKKHVVKKLLKEVGLNFLLIYTKSGAGGEVLVRVGKALSSTAYDRSLEQEADLQGAEYMINAGMNAGAMADFLARLGETNKNKFQISWLSTHPDSKSRADYIRAYIANKHYKMQQVLAPGTWERMKGLSTGDD